MDSNQIKTKERVRDLGEVYTNRREVEAMLDLVGDITYKMGTRILEPACGNGNFLDVILERKLVHVENTYKKHGGIKRIEYNIIKSLASTYGIDIDISNVIESRKRLLQRVKNFYSERLNTNIANVGFYESVNYILERNIIHGDSLNGQDKIIFSEFKKISDDNYALSESRYPYLELLKPNNEQTPLFVFNEINYLELYKNNEIFNGKEQ